MLKLDNTLLDELGLGVLPEDQKRAMLQHIYDTLELRVGTNLANQMTDQQLEEFEKFIDEGGDADQAQALKWLESNLPNYKQVVNEVFEALKLEIKQMAPQLLAASGFSAAPAAGFGQPPAPTAPVAPTPMSPYAPATPAGPTPASPFAADPMADPAANPLSGSTFDPVSTPAATPAPEPTAVPGSSQPPFIPAAPVPMSPLSDPLAPPTPQAATDSFATPAQPSQPAPYVQPASNDDSTAQQGTTDAQGYQFPNQQPPAGPGSYPSQHPGQ